jgi:hypothetical protein
MPTNGKTGRIKNLTAGFLDGNLDNQNIQPLGVTRHHFYTGLATKRCPWRLRLQ